jgi:hypothetical protein
MPTFKENNKYISIHRTPTLSSTTKVAHSTLFFKMPISDWSGRQNGNFYPTSMCGGKVSLETLHFKAAVHRECCVAKNYVTINMLLPLQSLKGITCCITLKVQRLFLFLLCLLFHFLVS